MKLIKLSKKIPFYSSTMSLEELLEALLLISYGDNRSDFEECAKKGMRKRLYGVFIVNDEIKNS